MLSVTFACAGCGKSHAIDDALAGKRARCKKCGAEIRVPNAQPAPTAREPMVSSSGDSLKFRCEGCNKS